MGKIYKTLIFDGNVSLSVLETTDVVNEAIKFHNLSPLCAAGLGRTLTAVAFMASNLKGKDERLSVTIDGNGAGGRIVAAADAALNVRGTIDRPEVVLPLKADGKLDVGGLVGNNGKITVVKNLGLKEPYVGRCNLVSGEIAEDFTAYYAYSEQQPTAMALGVLIGKDGSCEGAGVVVLQPMPDCLEEDIEKAEKLMEHFGNISYLMKDGGAEEIVKKYFGEYSFAFRETRYKCNCCKDYIDKVLLTIGKAELIDTAEKEGKVEVCCQFCDKKYVYKREDIENLFDGK
ncbi:MAG TPA: Hsp33 family molecular chaperone HslO [Clostridiales bacterium]|nr:Hsp33 family molecular chaperone HslO [Clostridiales bacterium]